MPAAAAELIQYGLAQLARRADVQAGLRCRRCKAAATPGRQVSSASMAGLSMASIQAS
jgi:hypothetical protein